MTKFIISELVKKVPHPSAKTIDAIFVRLEKKFPDPKTELTYSNPFTLLVAVVLSAHTTDVSVNKATPALFALADTPKKMAALGEGKVKELIRTIGLYNAKAKNVIALSRKLVDEFGGEVPQDHEALTTLPGVGRKTANVVMNEAFGVPTMAVDTHVHRVAHRLGLANGRTPDKVEEELNALVPDAHKLKAHIRILLHGRYTCKARTPECWQCELVDLCPFPDKNLVTPSVKKKKA